MVLVTILIFLFKVGHEDCVYRSSISISFCIFWWGIASVMRVPVLSSNFTGFTAALLLVSSRAHKGSHTSIDFEIKWIWRTFQLVIMLMSVYDGPLYPASKSHSISCKLKLFVHAVLMLLNVGSQPSGTIVSALMREYFWHFPSTVKDSLWTVM